MKSNHWATQKNGCVITLAAAMPSLIEAGKLPKRVKVLNWGENLNARGAKVVVGDMLLSNMKSPVYPFNQVPLDFEHNTTPGTTAYADSKEPRDVAGYVGFEVVPKDGVYMLIHSWTPLGLDKAHNYADVSATPLCDKQGNVVGITSVALCRVGAVPGMEFVDVPLSALLVSTNQTSASASTATADKEEQLMREKLCALLKLDPATCTDDDIEVAFEAAMKAPAAPAPLSVDVAKLVNDAVTPLNASIEGFRTEMTKRDKEQVILSARIEGKVVALNAEAIGQLSLDALKQHVAALPVTVPLSAQTPAHVAEGAIGTITEEQRAIALACGQDPEKVYGKTK
jgi:phage I-like protein